MKTYECHKAEPTTTKTGKALKKLVLQEQGAQYPIKNVTLWGNHPLFEEIVAGWSGELEIETKDSEVPNPHGGFFKNRTVLDPSYSPKAKPPQESVRQVSNAEIKNYLDLKMMPALREMYKLLATIEGRQELQMGLNERAIDRAMGHDVPPDEPVESPF